MLNKFMTRMWKGIFFIVLGILLCVGSLFTFKPDANFIISTRIIIVNECFDIVTPLYEQKILSPKEYHRLERALNVSIEAEKRFMYAIACIFILLCGMPIGYGVTLIATRHYQLVETASAPFSGSRIDEQNVAVGEGNVTDVK